MSAKSFGTAREHKVMTQFSDREFIVIRAAGSLGPIDFVALRTGLLPRLVQVKSDAAGPFAHFGPDDRYWLTRDAGKAGGVALLAHWPKRGECLWYAGPDWQRYSARDVFGEGTP